MHSNSIFSTESKFLISSEILPSISDQHEYSESTSSFRTFFKPVFNWLNIPKLHTRDKLENGNHSKEFISNATIGKNRELTSRFFQLRDSFLKDMAPRKQFLKRALVSQNRQMLITLLSDKSGRQNTSSACYDCRQPFKLLIHSTRYTCDICNKIICHNCRKGIQILPNDVSRELLVTCCPSCFVFTKALQWLFYPPKSKNYSSQVLYHFCEESISLNTKLLTLKAQMDGLILLANTSPSTNFPMDFCEKIMTSYNSLETCYNRLSNIYSTIVDNTRIPDYEHEKTISKNLLVYIRRLQKKLRPEIENMEKKLMKLIRTNPNIAKFFKGYKEISTDQNEDNVKQ